ncbi:MAG TPA: TetR/AcrR family transcriptional regulator [Solirubrobacterales bacterium]|nr:TetR/AcrR family transcriptional regulator [Solirubrobacterales bacterium]
MGESGSDEGRRYGGRSAAERSEERRLRLLDAGLELFGTRGYAATTIEALCAEARLNPRYFYAEFDSREALLRAVYDRHVEEVREAVLAAIAAAPPDPRGRLTVALRAFIDGSLADERAARVNYFEMVGVNGHLEARRREVLGSYADLVAEQIAAMEPPILPATVDLRMGAVALVSATDGLIIDALGGPGDPDRDGMIATLAELFTQGTD